MNAKKIARIIEVLFQGHPGDEEAPLPHSKRFQWKDPKTGKAPPRPPSEMLPNDDDMQALDAEPSPQPQGAAPTSAPDNGLPDDRTGSVPMSDMIGKGELATIDQLLDTYLQMQKTHGPEAAKAWFDRYRTAEFESILRRMVGAILEDSTA